MMGDESDRLEVLVRLLDEGEAALIVQALEAEEIPARAVGGFTNRLFTDTVGHMSVLVRSEDRARAEEVLARRHGEEALEEAPHAGEEEPAEDSSSPDAPSSSPTRGGCFSTTIELLGVALAIGAYYVTDEVWCAVFGVAAVVVFGLCVHLGLIAARR